MNWPITYKNGSITGIWSLLTIFIFGALTICATAHGTPPGEPIYVETSEVNLGDSRVTEYDGSYVVEVYTENGWYTDGVLMVSSSLDEANSLATKIRENFRRFYEFKEVANRETERMVPKTQNKEDMPMFSFMFGVLGSLIFWCIWLVISFMAAVVIMKKYDSLKSLLVAFATGKHNGEKSDHLRFVGFVTFVFFVVTWPLILTFCVLKSIMVKFLIGSLGAMVGKASELVPNVEIKFDKSKEATEK